MIDYHREEFTPEERGILSTFFTNVDGPVFALVNLQEVVKGALFARYSRSPKSVRRLFLDEFYDGTGAVATADVGAEHAAGLFRRVVTEFGDDSVAQLGGVHLACEQASNILTKVLEWGRLAAYLEQSTRYIFYDRKLGERYRYTVPSELSESPLRGRFVETMEWLFTSYSELVTRLVTHYGGLYPREEDDSESVWRSTIRARACDDIRGMLPAATTSNVGIYASGQAYEMMLIRMRAHPLAEVRLVAAMMLTELRKVIPSFLHRVDLPGRGEQWSDYLAQTAGNMRALADRMGGHAASRPEVTLVDWDPDAEVKMAAAALYAYSHLPDDQLLEKVRTVGDRERSQVLAAYVGDRSNRRHKPGRAMERTHYRFDILCDYGAFRDLQRHRMLTLEWQLLSPRHGYVTPASIAAVGGDELWTEAMNRTGRLWEDVASQLGEHVAQYAIPFAYRIRFYMDLNAREALHLLELRTSPGGHPNYRRICQEMHRLIGDQAGHRALADAMKFVDHTDYDLARLEGERKAEARRAAAAPPDQ